LLVLGIKET
jgi:hypothetical protein